MEYMDGGTFKDLILNPAKFAKLDDSKCFDLMDQFTAGLAELHRMDVVHRDLKPENIVVNFDFSKLKLIDVGIAVDLDPRYARKDERGEVKRVFTTNAGTQMWQPPELRELKSKHGGYSITSDIYGCGLVIQFVVRRKLPYTRVADWANN